MVLCLLAIDEEEEDDIALQIHFTLIQSFCCDNDINIVRVSGMQRLAQLLGEPAETQGTTEARDLHCLLVTVSWASWVCPAPLGHLGWCLSTKSCTSSALSHDWHVPWAAPQGPRHPASYFEPACFPHRVPGRKRPLLGLPLNPIFFPSHRTLTQMPGRATAWWR